MTLNSNIKPVSKPRDFDISELFFSITDRRSAIQGCNDVFSRISGYESAEILQKPHNLIRHPDMPRAVFKLLWEYILADRPIGAYVKNMAKSGEYYWVFALVIPIPSGFLSIRLKPSSDLFPEVEKIYASTINYQQSFDGSRNDAMEQSAQHLLDQLLELGFDSYDDFMAQALHKEAAARQSELGAQLTSSRPLTQSLDNVSSLIELRKRLCNTSSYFETLALEIRRVAINASVVAARLKEGGLPLGVISKEVSRVAEQITEEAGKLRKEVNELRGALYGASFTLSFLTLLGETQSFFETESQKNTLSPEEQQAKYGMHLKDMQNILDESAQTAHKQCGGNLETLSSTLNRFHTFVDSLAQILLTLQFGYVTGKSISVNIPGGHEFSMLLEDLATCSRDSRTELTNIRSSLRQATIVHTNSIS